MSAEKDKHLANGYKKAKAKEEALSKELVKVELFGWIRMPSYPCDYVA